MHVFPAGLLRAFVIQGLQYLSKDKLTRMWGLGSWLCLSPQSEIRPIIELRNVVRNGFEKINSNHRDHLFTEPRPCTLLDIAYASSHLTLQRPFGLGSVRSPTHPTLTSFLPCCNGVALPIISLVSEMYFFSCLKLMKTFLKSSSSGVRTN